MIKPNKPLSATVLTLGFLFLYIPIISLVVFSFNESKLVTVWSGFSLKWYGALLHDDELLTAAWLSLKIGLMTACASVVITLSVDDLVLSAFLSGPGSTTLPLVVFSRVRLGLNPEMNALATLFITAVTIGVIVVNQWMLMRDRKRTRDMQMAFAIADAADAPSTTTRPAVATNVLDTANA